VLPCLSTIILDNNPLREAISCIKQSRAADTDADAGLTQLITDQLPD
jgi:hypothetical protein